MPSLEMNDGGTAGATHGVGDATENVGLLEVPETPEEHKDLENLENLVSQEDRGARNPVQGQIDTNFARLGFSIHPSPTDIFLRPHTTTARSAPGHGAGCGLGLPKPPVCSCLVSTRTKTACASCATSFFETQPMSSCTSSSSSSSSILNKSKSKPNTLFSVECSECCLCGRAMGFSWSDRNLTLLAQVHQEPVAPLTTTPKLTTMITKTKAKLSKKKKKPNTRGPRAFSYTTLGLICLQCTNATHLTCFVRPGDGFAIQVPSSGTVSGLDDFALTSTRVDRSRIHFTTDVVVLRQRKLCLEFVVCDLCGLAHAACCLPASTHRPRNTKNSPRNAKGTTTSSTPSSSLSPTPVRKRKGSDTTLTKKPTKTKKLKAQKPL